MMKKFSVLIHGKDYLIQMDEGIENLGFYTTKYVEAESEDLAEFKAAKLIQNDYELNRAVQNSADNPPIIFAD